MPGWGAPGWEGETDGSLLPKRGIQPSRFLKLRSAYRGS